MGPLLLLIGVGLLVALSLPALTREKLEPTLFIQKPPYNSAEVDRIFGMADPTLIPLLKEEAGFDQAESDAVRQEVIDKVSDKKKAENKTKREIAFKSSAVEPIAKFYTVYKNATWPIAEADIDAYVEENYTGVSESQTVEKATVRMALLKKWLKAYYSDQLYKDTCSVKTAGEKEVIDAVAEGSVTPASVALTGIAKLYDDYRRAYSEYRVSGDPAQRSAYEAIKAAIETELANKQSNVQESDKYLKNFADTYQSLPEMEQLEKKAIKIRTEGKQMENEMKVTETLGKEIPVDYTPYYVKVGILIGLILVVVLALSLN